jgi:hypothetical protein
VTGRLLGLSLENCCIGPLVNTSDMHVCCACHCYTYTSDGQSTCLSLLSYTSDGQFARH